MRNRHLRLSLVPLVVGYLFLVGYMTLSQDRLLYLPDPTPPSETNLRPLPGLELAPWPREDVADFRGYVRARPPSLGASESLGGTTVSHISPSSATPPPLNHPTPRGTVLLFHGNAGTARGRAHYLEALESLGVRVVLAEYPGYGGRQGELSEASLVADGRETLRQVRATFGDPVWVWGESMGAAVAAQVGGGPAQPAAGVFLITPWDNLPDLAQSIYWYLPARWLVRDRYDSRAALRLFDGPIGMLIAGQDSIIPPEHSQGLYAALPEPKRQWFFPTADHNNWPARPREQWWAEALDWLNEQERLKPRQTIEPQPPRNSVNR